MSRAKVRTELAGYGEPLFPEGVDRLNTICDRRREGQEGLNGAVLDRVGDELRGFVENIQPTTIDGYTWFWALEFERDGGRIVVCFPWAQDWDKRDDSQADRSIAVYAHGVSGEAVDRLLAEIAHVLEILERA